MKQGSDTGQKGGVSVTTFEPKTRAKQMTEVHQMQV